MFIALVKQRRYLYPHSKKTAHLYNLRPLLGKGENVCNCHACHKHRGAVQAGGNCMPQAAPTHGEFLPL